MKNFFKLLTLSVVSNSFLFSMSLEEKVGQIIMCPVHGNEIDEEVKGFLEETKIGGVIL